MTRRFFKLDKNYILREAQEATRDELLQELVNRAKEQYRIHFNPLGLIDDTVLRIQNTKHPTISNLHDFYHVLAGVYRFKFGSNQLELVFDGRSHYEKYADDWKEAFTEWTSGFFQHKNFIKAVLEVTIFYPKKRKAQLAEMRMRAFLNQHFDLRINKRYGILGYRSA